MSSLQPETLFRALADETRLRCVVLLLDAGELCVCDLTRALLISQPKVSKHLAVLREAGLVQARREGLWMHYRVNPDLPGWATELLSTSARLLAAQPRFAEDRRLLGAPSRPGPAAYCAAC